LNINDSYVSFVTLNHMYSPGGRSHPTSDRQNARSSPEGKGGRQTWQVFTACIYVFFFGWSQRSM
jgi:hypothetical protein